MPTKPEMTATALVELLHLFESAAIPVWLDGGWGVDALLQRQTRPHADVDIIPRVADVPKLLDLLGPLGFVLRKGQPPHVFVLGNQSGLELDIHAVIFDEQGNAIHRMENGDTWLFQAEAFTGRGILGGLTVHCLSPAAQVQCHAQGYAPTEKDLRDMELLAERFKIQLPPLLRRPDPSRSGAA